MDSQTEASLPILYARWLRTITDGPIPAETKATCESCAMLPSPGSPAAAVYFHPAVKCCSYQPDIPNYLAGGVLLDEDPALEPGRAALERRIQARISIRPNTVGAGAVFPLLYYNTPNVFGRAPALKCPYLRDDGGCGVWRHRPSVCATWFCKYVRGRAGFDFWRLTHRLFTAVQHDLELWCLAELGLGSADTVEPLVQPSSPHPDVSELQGAIDWSQYRRLWGAWAGREIEFYRACAELVNKLEWEQVLALSGPKVRILTGLVRDAFENLNSSTIPERLRTTGFRVQPSGGKYVATTFSGYDPVTMPESLLNALKYFDGRPTEEALEAILRERNLRLDPALIRRMIDFGVLEAVPPVDAAFPIL